MRTSLHLPVALLLLLTLSCGLSAQPRDLAAETNRLYDQAFRGQRTDEAARDVEIRIATHRQGDFVKNAPIVVELFGGLAGMYFAAHREADGEAVLRRLYTYAREAPDETLFFSGVRKCLAVPAFRRFANRNSEIKVLKKLKRELEEKGEWNTPLQLDERFHVALVDAIGTAYMLDRNGSEALKFYREARVRGDSIYRNIRAPDENFKEAYTINCRIFPRCGLISTYMIMGEMDSALEVYDQLESLGVDLEKRRMLPSTHPARQAFDGAARALAEAYGHIQAEKIRRGQNVPKSLAERKKWDVMQARKEAMLQEVERKHAASGKGRVSPFAGGK